MSESVGRSSNVTLFICLGLGLLGWFMDPPSGLTLTGWHLLVVFIVTILSVMLKPLPMCASTLIALGVLVVTNTLETSVAFSGFAHPVIWLLVFALIIAQGFVQTGLGRRIGYHFMRRFGKRSLGLSYGLVLTDLMIAPAVPSVTARSAGIVLPIMQGIATSYDSHPFDPSSRRLGTFLNLTVFQVTVITSAMFMTAMAANSLLTELTLSQGLEMSWKMWALAACVPGAICLLLTPLLLYVIAPPELKETPEAPEYARKALNDMGPMSQKEWVLGSTLILLLLLWIFGDLLQIKAMVAGLLGVGVLAGFRVLDWNAILSRQAIWETFIWFSILLMMASAMNGEGVMVWMSNHITHWVGDLSWTIAFPCLALFYYYSHYLFASSTAHVTAMYVPFLSVAIAIGTPPYLAMFILLFFSNLFGGLTHYSLAPAPALLAAGYTDLKLWWRVGLIFSFLHILVWGGIGSLWWHFLGYW